MTDDYTWQHLPPLLSSFTSTLLANPWLQFLDVSNTSLTNNGVFCLLLEVSHCDPRRANAGMPHLKQLRCGPPADQPAPGHPQWLASVADALQEAAQNCPMLESISLVSRQAANTAGDQLSFDQSAISICTQWQLQEGRTVEHNMLGGQHEAVLCTKCVCYDTPAADKVIKCQITPWHNAFTLTGR